MGAEGSNMYARAEETETMNGIARNFNYIVPDPSPYFTDYFPINNFPNEILELILSYLSGPRLVKSCQFVSHRWHTAVNSQTLWRIKCIREKRYIPEVMGPPPEDYKKFYFANPYQRNFIKNPLALDAYQHWRIKENGGDKFTIEQPSENYALPGCDRLPDQLLQSNSALYVWATSFSKCRKSQKIDLIEEGCSRFILDIVRPKIIACDWVTTRKDCGAKYKLEIELQDEDMMSQRVAVEDYAERQWQGGQWRQVKIEITDYDPGLRYIKFTHGGRDTQFWAGHYGPKFTGSSVTFDFSNINMR